MKKKKKIKAGEKKGIMAFIDRHYGDDLEPNKMRTPLKIVGDTTSIVAGTALASTVGKGSFFLGAGLVVIGRLINDKTGLLGMLGSSIVGYSVAMAKENNQAEETTVNGISLGTVTQGIKARFSRLKENWLHATYLNKVLGEKDPEDEPVNEAIEAVEADETIGAIDLHALDQIESKIEESAVKTEINRIQKEDNASLFVDLNQDFENDEISAFDDHESNSFLLHETNKSEGEFDHLEMATM